VRPCSFARSLVRNITALRLAPQTGCALKAPPTRGGHKGAAQPGDLHHFGLVEA
jgi:hypothetical protein